MKRITKLLTVSLAVTLCFCLASCGSNEPEEEGEGMENPLVSVDQQGLIDETGINLPAPENAENVEYYVIKGELAMAEMRFTLDGKEAYLRAVPTDLTELIEGEEDPDNPPDISLKDLKGDISGLNYEWEDFASIEVMERQGYYVMGEGAGYVAWLDVVPGILYNLGMEQDADIDSLLNTAEKVFVPLQGDSE